MSLRAPASAAGRFFLGAGVWARRRGLLGDLAGAGVLAKGVLAKGPAAVSAAAVRPPGAGSRNTISSWRSSSAPGAYLPVSHCDTRTWKTPTLAPT